MITTALVHTSYTNAMRHGEQKNREFFHLKVLYFNFFRSRLFPRKCINAFWFLNAQHFGVSSPTYIPVQNMWFDFVFDLTSTEWQNENRRRDRICRSFVSLFEWIKICCARIFIQLLRLRSHSYIFSRPLSPSLHTFRNPVLHAHVTRRQQRCRHPHRRLRHQMFCGFESGKII